MQSTAQAIKRHRVCSGIPGPQVNVSQGRRGCTHVDCDPTFAHRCKHPLYMLHSRRTWNSQDSQKHKSLPIMSAANDTAARKHLHMSCVSRQSRPQSCCWRSLMLRCRVSPAAAPCASESIPSSCKCGTSARLPAGSSALACLPAPSPACMRNFGLFIMSTLCST